MRIYLVTEACFHVSYLINMLNEQKAILNDKENPFSIILRQKNVLDAAKLSMLHEKLYAKTALANEELAALEEAYTHKLSAAELALIKLHGIPKLHILSLPISHTCSNLNAPELLDALANESKNTELAAVIFLDCILKPRWIEIFKNRIVNAHSAILPHARGMYAIEQITALGNPEQVLKSAGATIHYIDEKVDMGQLIKTKPLTDIWKCEDIWQVKAESYLSAFELLVTYLTNPQHFSLTDGLAFQDPIGPVFKAKDFTPSVAQNAMSFFKTMRQEHAPSQPAATPSSAPQLN